MKSYKVITLICIVSIFLSNLCTPEYNEIEDNGLVAYWSFDDISGNIAPDEAGDNDGTIYGANVVDGISGKALDFDGMDDYVNIPSTNPDIDGQSFSVEVWVKLNSLGQEIALFKGKLLSYGTSNDRDHALHFGLRDADTLTLAFYYDDLDADYSLETNKWYHIVGSYNALTKEQALFINGELKNKRTAINHLSTTNDDPWQIGRIFYYGSNNNNDHFNGIIDEVKIYNHALTASEISEQYYQQDLDRDGILNVNDQCPNTTTDCGVNSNGCPLDSDNDGVCNGMDACPGTPQNCNVSSTGCKIDSDGDGICNGVDPCPNDPKDCCIATTDNDNDGLQESNANCSNYDNYPNDHDNDGVASSVDCNDSNAGNTKTKGDADGDGMDNCIDPCPNDRNNCCTAGTDNDNDGLQESNANCPNYDNYPNDHDNDGIVASTDCNDSNAGNTKTKGDADGDGMDNCVDPCPDDRNNCCAAGMDNDNDGLQENNANCPNYDNYPNDHDNDGIITSTDCDDSNADNIKTKGDSDSDGIDNCADSCPADPANKCRCVDSDGDGIGEGTGCQDHCPNDRNNCCTAETDNDNDGLQENNANCPNYDNYLNDHDNDGVITLMDCDDSDADNIKTKGKCSEEQIQIPAVNVTVINEITIMNAITIANETIFSAVATINKTKSNLNVSEESAQEVKEKIKEVEDLIEQAKEKIALAESLAGTEPEKAKGEAENAKDLADNAMKIVDKISRDYKVESSVLPAKPQPGVLISGAEEQDEVSGAEEQDDDTFKWAGIMGFGCFIILVGILIFVLSKRR